MTDVFGALLTDYTLRTVALGSALLGAASGALGAFAVLRRQSLIGDAVSHAALPGIALAFMLTGSRAALPLLIGAALAGWLATLAVLAIVRVTRVRYDAALALILSVFFGIGLMLTTAIQQRPDAAQAGLTTFLFGQAASLVERDLATLAVAGFATLLILFLLWKEFQLLAFDPDFAATIGLPVRLLDVALTGLIVIAIVTGLQSVGVVLMSALLVAPAAAARQWTDRLGMMVLLSALFGALSGIAGALASGTVSHLPTGPAIIVFVSLLVVISLLFAPRRGIAARAFADRRTRNVLRGEALLADLARLEAQHATRATGHSAAVLRVMNPGRRGIEETLRRLESSGLVRRTEPDQWTLTVAGRDAAALLGQRASGEEGTR